MGQIHISFYPKVLDIGSSMVYWEIDIEKNQLVYVPIGSST